MVFLLDCFKQGSLQDGRLLAGWNVAPVSDLADVKPPTKWGRGRERGRGRGRGRGSCNYSSVNYYYSL
jgi:hypothetical protein